MNRLLLSIFSLFVLFGTVVPLTPDFAIAANVIPPGETKPEEAYVQCGTVDKTKEIRTVNQGGQTVITTAPAKQKVPGPGGVGEIEIDGDGIIDNPCKFTHIIVLAKKLIIGLIVFGVIIATMGFAYAGLLYITAMGSTEKVSHAHSIFVKTFWGFVFMLSAWLIAYTMESIFLADWAKGNSFLQK